MRYYAATNALAVREYAGGLADIVRQWGAGGYAFQYWVGLTAGSYLEGTGGMISAIIVDPLSTVEGVGSMVGQYYERGGVIGVVAGMTGLIGLYESYSGVDYLSGETLNGDKRFDRAWSGVANLMSTVGGSGIARNIAQNGIKSAFKAGVRGAPRGTIRVNAFNFPCWRRFSGHSMVGYGASVHTKVTPSIGHAGSFWYDLGRSKLILHERTESPQWEMRESHGRATNATGKPTATTNMTR